MIEWHERRFDESEAELQDALTSMPDNAKRRFSSARSCRTPAVGSPAPPPSNWLSAATT
jgi:hypothetical protein